MGEVFSFKLFITKNIKFMKKTVFMVCAALVMSATAIVGVKAYNYYSMPELMKANLEALTQEDMPTGGDGWTRAECQAQGGNWNMATICEEMQIIKSTCKIDGEISILGITIKGAFEKGKKYTIAYALYTCTPSATNCCIKQGIYANNNKVA